MQIRDAVLSDSHAITAIYNEGAYHFDGDL